MSAAPAAMDRLRFGAFLAPNIMPVYETVTEEVGRRLGIATELVVETDCVAWPIAALVLTGARYAGGPLYFSDVIVHRESPFRSILDLRGYSWAYDELLSHSGYASRATTSASHLGRRAGLSSSRTAPHAESGAPR